MLYERINLDWGQVGTNVGGIGWDWGELLVSLGWLVGFLFAKNDPLCATELDNGLHSP